MYTSRPWELSDLSAGDAGIRETVKRMQQLVDEAVKDQNVVVFAQELSRPAGVVQSDAVLLAIIEWVRPRWVFRPDPVKVELVKTPDRLLKEAAQFGSMLGDCDDASVLIASLCAAVGYPTSFVVIQRNPRSKSYDHVYVEAWNGREWLALDGVARGRPPFYRPDFIPGRLERFVND